MTHESAHMLLDTAQHLGSDANLMMHGSEITQEQCAQMQLELERLYGDQPLVDPLSG